MSDVTDIDSFFFNLGTFVAAVCLLEYGADKFIDHTTIIARRHNVSPTLVGLLTCGAEWEELVVIAVALGQRDTKLALGNLMGSTIANILASFSLGLLVLQNASFDRSSKIYALVLLVLTSIFLVVLFTVNTTWRLVAGCLLVATFAVYIGSVAVLIYRGTLVAPEDDSDSDEEEEDEDEDDGRSDSDVVSDEEKYEGGELARPRDDREKHTGRPRSSGSPARSPRGALLRQKPGHDALPSSRQRKPPRTLRYHVSRLLVGLLALLLSGYLVAHSAAAIGGQIGLSGTVVGTTILSIATTLPEKFISVMGGLRRQPGIMVANTVGSNIFLLTLCGGVLLIWGDTDELRNGFTVIEASVMWLSAAIILCIVLGGGKRWMGVGLLCLYASFLAVEVVMGRKDED